MKTIVIDARYNGPPTSGNGGYTCGVVAGQVSWDGLTEVTLRTPPPLDEPLTVAEADGALTVRTADARVVAEARPAGDGSLTPVPPVSHAEAVAASRDYLGFGAHPFRTCFVCGPGRPDADGLGIFPGRISGQRTAAPFTVPDDVGPELVWAALDCPGGWAVPQNVRPHVLGRCAVRIDELPAPGDACVVMGQLTGTEGRKSFALTSLYAPDGRLLATSRSTWIALA